MNFTGEIKRELTKRFPEKRCCALALLCGALDTCGDYSLGRVGVRDGFTFTNEHEEVAAYLLALAERTFGVRMTLAEAVKDPKHGRDKLTFTYAGSSAGEYAGEIAEHSAKRGLKPCCAVNYLKGAFLGGGSCSIPHDGKKGYHLEIVFRETSDAEAFRELIDGLQLIGSVVGRGDTSVVYCKSRESISDFLSVAGADGALRTLGDLTALREESNNENRVLNCLAGNADRAALASLSQVVAFGELRRSGKYAALDPRLREAAEARLAHPELSLAELAALLGVSKSCLNHRFRKLMSLCRGEE